MISILMAAYNGEKYLHAQLDSLFGQSISDFILYIQDDASTDSTWDILTDYHSKFPEKIKLSKLEKNSGNAKHNFLNLMATVQDDYLMLCDQDDVWQPNKIETTLAKIKSIEVQYPGQPVLVYTDLTVVDKDLHLINASYKQAMNSDYTRNAFNQLLIQNTLTGCTAVYNRHLAELLTRKPDFCIMHDWWLQLVAAAFGKIGHVDEPTVLYRQHEKNTIGAKNMRKFSYKLGRFMRGNEIKNAIQATYLQAESLLETYGDLLSPSQKEIVRMYCAIPNMNKLNRWRTICKLKTFKIGISRKIAHFIFV